MTIRDELQKIAAKNNLQFFTWGIEGGRGWIWFKQDDERKFKVQIFTNDNFEVYNSIKSDIVRLLSSSKNCSLVREDNLEKSFGYRRNLYFVDTEAFQAQIREKESLIKGNSSPTFNIGQIKADGSILTFGDVINSTQSIDNSIKLIENQIEEKGGDDKEELHATLREAKKVIEEMYQTKEIRVNKSFSEKLTGHLSKHGWFYGATINLLGTALLKVVSG